MPQYKAVSSKIIPLNLHGKPWGLGRIPPNSQKFTHFPPSPEKSPLINLYLLLSKESFLLHQIAISSNHPIKASFVAAVIAVVSCHANFVVS